MPLSTKDKQKPFLLFGAVLAGIVIQWLLGEDVPWLIHVTEIGVFFVILAVMLPVEIGDVGRAFRKVKPTVLALTVNFLLIPLISWSLGWLFLQNYPDFWVGAILYTLTPCIGWYLIFTDIAKGNVAWGIALLPWNVTLQIILLPVYLYLLVGKVIPVEAWALLRSVALLLVAPFVLSHFIQKAVVNRRGREYFLGPFNKTLSEVKLWALVIVILSMFASQKSIGLSEVNQVAFLILFLILFFLVLFCLVLAIGRAFHLSYGDNVTLAFTCTARNSEAVIGIAVAAFPGHPLVYLAIILGPIIELPMLLLIARALLGLRPFLEKKID